MNKPHHHFQNRSSDVNCLPQYDYEPNAQDGLKMHAEQFSNYDNNQYSMNQPSFSYNHAMIEQDSGYHESGLRILQDHQQGVYHGYTPTDPDHYAQPSPSNYSPISQNISPIAFSSDNRQFYQDQVMGAIPINPPLPHNPLNSNKDEMPIIPSNDSSFSDLTLQNKPLDSMPSDAEKSVNGILEMEGSVEPNGPILGNHGYIPAQTMQKAYYELGETPEIKAACIRGLRQQIDIHQEENNFDEHSDAFLLKFLRSRKFDVEAAYALLERYYNVRENKPEVFRNLTRKNVKRTMEQGIVGVLPQRDKKGRVIMTFNFSKWNMSLPFHFEKLLRVFVYTLEKLFESEETQINGVVVICNLSQLSVLQTKSLGVTMIEKSVEIFQENFPFRLSAIHLLNPPWHFKLLWRMVDPLTKIKQKIARRIYIHDGDLSRFNSEFDSEILPKELGGKCPPYNNALWVNEILEPEQSQSQKMQALQKPATQAQKRSPLTSRKVYK